MQEANHDQRIERIKAFLGSADIRLPGEEVLRAIVDHSDSLISQFENSGRMSLLNKDPSATLIVFKLQYDSRKMSIFLPKQEILDKNKNVVFPLLQEAIEGSNDARKFYSNERILNLSQLSDQGKADVLSRLQTLISQEKVSLKSHLNPDLRKYVSDSALRDTLKYQRGVEYDLGLHSIFTYQTAEYLLSHVSHFKYEKYVRASLHPMSKRVSLDNEMFNPLSYGPAGKLASDLFGKCVNQMQKTLLLEDFLESLGVDLSWQIKKLILSSYKDTWDLGKSKVYKNLLYLTEQREAGLIEEDLLSKILGNYKALNSYEIQELIQKQRQKSEPNQKTASKIADKAAKTSHKLFYSKREFIEGILSSLSTITHEHQNAAQRLYALYTRGMVSYSEALDLALEGQATTEEFINSALEKRGAIYRLSFDRGETIQSENQKISDVREQTFDKLKINGTESAWFQKWLSQLSKQDCETVTKRLERAENGILGRSRQMVIDRRIFELKISSDKEIRIYFYYNAQNEISLLQAGTKDSQESDIGQAIRNLNAELS